MDPPKAALWAPAAIQAALLLCRTNTQFRAEISRVSARELRMPRTGWTPSLVPYGADQTVYLVIDRFGQIETRRAVKTMHRVVRCQGCHERGRQLRRP
jgi:hypothetical protein